MQSMEYRGLPSAQIRRCQKDFTHSQIKDACPKHQNNAVSYKAGRPFRLLFSKIYGKLRGTADPQKQGYHKADGGQWVRHIGGGIAQVADSLPDKNLVHDVIKRTDQRGCDETAGTPQKQENAAHRSGMQSSRSSGQLFSVRKRAVRD